MENIENGFAQIGLTTPSSRFFASAAVGGIFEYYFRPSFSYDKSGNPRQWKVISPDDPNSTMFPPGSIALLLGAIFSLVV